MAGVHITVTDISIITPAESVAGGPGKTALFEREG
jgi:hypothetical protein